MKTLKYRSVLASLSVAALSVFLFTACEKESDNPGGGDYNEPSRIEKFKRLKFSTGSASSNSGSGTFIGGGSFTDASQGGGDNQFAAPNSSETQFAAASSNQVFTDPMSTGTSFTVNNPFSAGGGSLTIDGTSYDLDFGFCASTDITGSFSLDNDTTEGSAELNAFIGVSGDFESFASQRGEDEPNDLGIDLFFYVFSYGGATQIGDFLDFEEGNTDGGAFVFAIEFDEDDGTTYFATQGSVNFSGSEVIITGAKMAKVDHELEGGLSAKLVDLQAQLECIQAPDED